MTTAISRLAEILDRRLSDASGLRSPKGYDDLSDISPTVLHEHLTGLVAAIDRIAPRRSTYGQQVDAILSSPAGVGTRIIRICGIARSLRRDIADGVLASAAELIHGELFSDFLEMAEHLLDSGYKDPAAVIAGSALEAHLRQLAAKHGLQSADANGRSKKADLLNAELAAVPAFSKLDQKSITAWLDLRNKAAHGHFAGYQADQVGLLIAGIRDFMSRCPA